MLSALGSITAAVETSTGRARVAPVTFQGRRANQGSRCGGREGDYGADDLCRDVMFAVELEVLHWHVRVLKHGGERARLVDGTHGVALAVSEKDAQICAFRQLVPQPEPAR